MRIVLLVVALACLSALLDVLVAGEIICPSDDILSQNGTILYPCKCYSSSINDQIILNCYTTCYNQNLNDSIISNLLDAFLAPGISPVKSVNLQFCGLTYVPTQLKSMPNLTSVQLQFNPQIDYLQTGDFDFPNADVPVKTLNLEPGPRYIAPNTFQGEGYGNGTQITIATQNNVVLHRFEATVFKRILEKMAPFYSPNTSSSYATYVELSVRAYEATFLYLDCDCHLAWLIRDNRHLLPVVRGGRCSNGTYFEDLDPNEFTDCPDFVCPLHYDGSYADPKACSSYYICNQNVPSHYDCPPNLVFNPNKGICDIVANVPSCQ